MKPVADHHVCICMSSAEPRESSVSVFNCASVWAWLKQICVSDSHLFCCSSSAWRTAISERLFTHQTNRWTPASIQTQTESTAHTQHTHTHTTHTHTHTPPHHTPHTHTHTHTPTHTHTTSPHTHSHSPHMHKHTTRTPHTHTPHTHTHTLSHTHTPHTPPHTPTHTHSLNTCVFHSFSSAWVLIYDDVCFKKHKPPVVFCHEVNEVNKRVNLSFAVLVPERLIIIMWLTALIINRVRRWSLTIRLERTTHPHTLITWIFSQE